MPSPQFKHVIETVEQLESSIIHMRTKWELFYSQGYLPETDVFKRLQKKADDLKKDLNFTRTIYVDIFKGDFPNKLLFNDGIYFPEKDKKFSKLLFKPNLSSEDLIELGGSDIKTRIKALNNITNNLYYDVETISDMLNALNYGFISRVSGVFSPETSFAKDIATKKFGGVQLVYDAAEALMKDYVDSFFDEDYNGLVVFGFRNRAVAYPTSLVVFPAFSEYDLEFLTILAHESFHSVQDSFNERINERKANKLPMDEKEEKMMRIKSDLRRSLIWLADIYRNEDFKDKNIPRKIVADNLAHELMADIYATYIAGESYPLMLYNYILPILINIKSGYCSSYDYSAYSLGSLKLRISLTTLKEIFKMRGYDINQLKFQFCGENKYTIDYLYREIERWENLSVNLTRIQMRDRYKKSSKRFKQGQPDKEIMMISDGKKITIKKELSRICEEIENKKIIQNMSYLVKHPFYPDEMSLEQFEKKISDIYDIFNGNPTYKQIADIWKDESWFRPKHLISILAKYPNINRNALLISLAYHKNITLRFN